MARLIDAAAVAKEIYELHYYLHGVRNGKTLLIEFSERFRNDVLKVICKAPTVDAEPVVHGHWVKHNFLGHEQYACSECQTLGSPQWKRCPVCEAKMDGGNEDV